MNIDQFKERFAGFKDVEKIQLTCDHPKHSPVGEMITIGKQPAKRNILKNGGKEFICRACFMRYNNPMNQVGENRQTDEIIVVFCPHPEHEGESGRKMKKAHYYGAMEEPFLQTCKRCVQLGKEISEEQRNKIRAALKGIVRSEEFKQKLREYMLNNPEGIARGKANLVPGMSAGWNEGMKMSEEVCKKMSESHTGKVFTDEHRQNISKGRKQMLEDTGGFTREHREKISAAVIEQYRRGFNPHSHHLNGWHESPKAGKVYYRSSYEKKAFLKLDADETVKTYQTESVAALYFNPKKKVMSKTIIDLEIEYINGSKKLVEIKPEIWLDKEVIIVKIEAGKAKAKELGYAYEVWTEMHLFGHVYNEKNMKLFVEKVQRGEV